MSTAKAFELMGGISSIDAIGRKSKSPAEGALESDTSAGQTGSGKNPSLLPSVVITRFSAAAKETSHCLISSPVQ